MAEATRQSGVTTSAISRIFERNKGFKSDFVTSVNNVPKIYLSLTRKLSNALLIICEIAL